MSIAQDASNLKQFGSRVCYSYYVSEAREMPGKLPPLKVGSLRERAKQIVDKHFSHGASTPAEAAELKAATTAIGSHEAALAQTAMPRQVGEFKEPTSDRTVSATFEGPGLVGLRYGDEDPSRKRIVSVDDFEGMKKMKSIISTNPMRKPGPITETS